MSCSKTSRAKNSRRRPCIPPYIPPAWSDHLYVEIDRADIAIFKFILESYDNLAYLSVLDKYRALVRLTFSPDAQTTIRALLDTLGDELTIRAVVHTGLSPWQVRVSP